MKESVGDTALTRCFFFLSVCLFGLDSPVKTHIEQYFQQEQYRRAGRCLFSCHRNLSPVVTTEQNFDSLLIPQDHPSRSSSDNYFVRAPPPPHAPPFRSSLSSFLLPPKKNCFSNAACNTSTFTNPCSAVTKEYAAHCLSSCYVCVYVCVCVGQ